MTGIANSLRLVPALFRFVGHDVVRARRVYLGTVLGAFAAVELLIALGAPGGSREGFGSRVILGLMIVAAPFCRSWLDEDVRLGYAAFWLQKPVGALEFYLARTLAVLGWTILTALALGAASTPAALAAVSLVDVAGALIVLGWIPTLLAVLSFLGSALGARNSGLFAYGTLFAGFALPGFRDAMWLGPAYDILERLLPPTFAALEANTTLREVGSLAALADLRPLLVYAMACGALGLALAVRAPRRLARWE